ncbi:MBL fold metallo-hydrolase [Paenibacillus tarimensis]|uniref:MBL fold metallo-hydrolase n=1 Tax=Paenibacillus tarimensis TaxID=416012 RepID=UPI0038B2BFA1
MSSYHQLPLEFTADGHNQVITPVILSDGDERILIDCGYPGFVPQLRQALQQESLELEDITKIIATHHDLDHIGSLAELQRMLPNVKIIAHELEKPYLEGIQKSQRLEQAELSLHSLPPEAIPSAEQFIAMLKSIETVEVGQTVGHGDLLPWCGGIEVVHTPGHMAGHISLYLPLHKTMIAGDAVVIEEGELNIANPQYTLDLAEAVASVRRLLTYDIKTLICYHGGCFQGNVHDALHNLVNRYS